jgi:uncharacterized protein YqeY
MTAQTTKERLTQSVKTAMRAKDKARLSTLRMALAEFKRVEVDERIEIDESRSLIILDKMLKQRKEAASQFFDAGRDELAAKEQAEIEVLKEFLPEPLSEDLLLKIINQAICDAGAETMRDMGKIMALVKPQVLGRADMARVSGLIKSLISS